MIPNQESITTIILVSIHVPGESRKVYAFGGYGIESMWSLFKTKMLIFQSKANLDKKI